jgi:hypothetical protein
MKFGTSEIFVEKFWTEGSFQAQTCPQQAAPTDATLEPLRYRCVALNVKAQLPWRKPPPNPCGANRSALIQVGDLNTSVANSVFFLVYTGV